MMEILAFIILLCFLGPVLSFIGSIIAAIFSIGLWFMLFGAAIVVLIMAFFK